MSTIQDLCALKNLLDDIIRMAQMDMETWGKLEQRFRETPEPTYLLLNLLKHYVGHSHEPSE